MKGKKTPSQAINKSKKRTEPNTTAPGVPEKMRLDVAVSKAAAVSRERAQALILGGGVKVDGETRRKAGGIVPQGATIEVSAHERFASRGGYKLERALDVFGWSVEGLRCLDVGASTGGFTDCLLQRGAASVAAVDVGYGLLAWPLRKDPRVRAIERTNFRHADASALGPPFDFACADVSFISLAKLALQFAGALATGGRMVALIKPQFEAGRHAVGRGGVVRDPRAQEAAIASVMTAFERAGLRCSHLTYSPIKGPAGNIEFLLGATRAQDVVAGDWKIARIEIEGVVRAAHETLDR